MSYTKGPWCVRGEDIGVISKDDDQSYGMFYGFAEVYGENEADNARLIAAAPELLEFIQEFANSTRVHFEAMRADPNEFVPYLKAMSLIRKATGDE